MRIFFLIVLLAGIAIVSIAGFRGSKSTKPPIEIFPDMDRQAKVKPQHASDFFGDGSGDRHPVEGAVPLGFEVPRDGKLPSLADAKSFTINDNSYLATGKMGEFWGHGMPEEIEVNADFIARGQERYAISCAVCHGDSGNGKGITSYYGLAGIANLHDVRLREIADGDLYNTITHGKGQMLGYGGNLTVRDRWAVVAYVRALQRSQLGSVSDLDSAQRRELEKGASEQEAKEEDNEESS